MKNIFLKETDQKSKLYRNLLTDKLFILEDKVTDVSECNREYQFIYITNDEEIKVNDYITDGYKVWQWKDDSSLLGRKKVILSTDQDSIKDGVQSIDDEFLEWFVKNPSCEEVEVMNVPDFIYQTKHSCYKIIIPKEEPKSLIEKMKTLQEQWQRDMLKTLQEPKQGTLEEAKLNEKEFYEYMAKQDSWKSTGLIIQEFIQLKLKEQDKNKYSEEEMLNFAWFLLKNAGQYSDDKTAHFEGKYLEQFKNIKNKQNENNRKEI